MLMGEIVTSNSLLPWDIEKRCKRPPENSRVYNKPLDSEHFGDLMERAQKSLDFKSS
jgi:hypothetical protein